METTTTSQGDDVEAIFRTACDSFRDNLPAEDLQEFSKYETSEQMLTAIRALAARHPVHQGKLLAVCQRVTNFSKNLEPYFDVVGIFVQSNPEYSALVWGSLSMIFKLSSNVVTFLENIFDKFDEIGRALPAYEHYAKLIRDRHDQLAPAYPRLAKALSQVYVDLLCFCHRTCLIFTRRNMSARFKISFIGRLMWKPFDVQFSDLISQLKSHKETLELELTVASAEETMRFYRTVEAKMRSEEATAQAMAERQRVARESAMERVMRLQQWIDAPRWAAPFEQAKSTRTVGTCEWIYDEPKFQKWQSQLCSSEPSLQDRVLSMKAKPGFGKTILCSAIIDRLGDYASNESDTAMGLNPAVAFYLFDERRGANTPSDAIRSLVAQLLHLNHARFDFVQEIEATRSKSRLGQRVATEDEVKKLFLHLVVKFPAMTFFVFDGLDECSDSNGFLQVLSQAVAQTQHACFLLLGRPTVHIPFEIFGGEESSIMLTSQSNFGDIGQYTSYRIQELMRNRLLPTEPTVDELVARICPRANGMFLWARLLMEYLRFPSLTLRQRLDAVSNLSRLEGLDNLYNQIWTSLNSQASGPVSNTLLRIFQWMSQAKRPIQIDEFEVAITTPADGPRDDLDTIPGMIENLGQMTGALLETDLSQRKVQFIHLSTLEFFRSTLSRRAATRAVATACLSYLNFTVPAQPLTKLIPSAKRIESSHKKYGLLNYTSRYWAEHLLDALGDNEEIANRDDSTALEAIMRLLKSFLYSREKITMWIEASWTFASIPSIPSLSPAARASIDPAMDSSEYSQLWKDIGELSLDLMTLSKSWQDVLRAEPNEIWEPSIPSFTRSRFWVSTAEARITPIAHVSRAVPTSIMIHSEISRSGTEVGIITLFPSKEWLSPTQPGHLDPGGDWEVRYDIWSLGSNKVLSSTRLILDPGHIRPLLCLRSQNDKDSLSYGRDRRDQSVHYVYQQQTPSARETGKGGWISEQWFKTARRMIPQSPWASASTSTSGASATSATDPGAGYENYEKCVLFPTAISEDLRRVLLCDTVICVPALVTPSFSLRQAASTFDRLSNKYHLDPALYVPLRDDVFLPEILRPSSHTKFSPSGKYICMIRESVDKATKAGIEYGIRWSLAIFRDEAFELTTNTSSYACIAHTIFFPSTDVAILSPDRGVVFHPVLPRLAFPQVVNGLPQTYVWDFESPIVDPDRVQPGRPANPLPLHDPPLIDPCFSDDGHYLYGTDSPIEFGAPSSEARTFSSPFVVRVPPPPARFAFLENAPSLGVSGELIQTNPLQDVSLMKEAIQDLAQRPKPLVQHSNTLVFDKDRNGVINVSHLHNLERQGAIVLRSFGSDGNLAMNTLHRLPQDIKKCARVSLVDPNVEIGEESLGGNRDELVKIVLNHAPKKVYSIKDVKTSFLPAVIERKKESIPSFWNTWVMRQSEFADEVRRPEALGLQLMGLDRPKVIRDADGTSGSGKGKGVDRGASI